MFDIKKQIKGDFNFDLKITQDFLEEIKIILKKEFIGIDEQIDMWIESIKPWLFFRDTLSKPLVVNGWGMTGCGKTKLIDRLLELLSLKNNSYRLNGSELNAEKPLRSLCSGHFTKNNFPVVIFDEFQNYKCKSSDGEEYEKYNSTLWDFIDNGLCDYENSYYINAEDKFGIYALGRIIDTLLYLENNTFNKLSFTLTSEELDIIKITNNNEKEEDEDDIEDDDCEEDDDYPTGKVIVRPKQKTKVKIVKKGDKYDTVHIYQHIMKDIETWFDNDGITFTLKDKFIVGLTMLLDLYEIKYGDSLKESLLELSFNEFIEFSELITENLVNSNKKATLDYSKSIIFVLGNVDEAYGIHDDMNPDISADEFYKISKKVNIVNIKEALIKRFRIEHIARLGNTHIIYPSLTSKAYKEIIVKQLNDYSIFIKENYKFTLKFDNTIHKILYKEAVFPTLGVRNVTTTINDMIKSNVANSLLYTIDNDIQYDTILYKYKNKNIHVDFIKNEKIVAHTTHKINSRVDSLRQNKKDDQQAVTGIHEAGHAMAQIMLFNKLPLQVRSITADSDSNGFTWTGVEDVDILNKNILLDKIKLCLAGRAAEIIVFGEDKITSGASNDLSKANDYLFKAYREWGMREYLVKNNILPKNNDVAKEITETIADKVNRELLFQMGEIKTILSSQKKLLLKLGEYLAEHPSINKKMLIKIIQNNSNINIDKLISITNFGYRDKLKEELELLNKM